MTAGEKLLRNSYERGPDLYRDELLDPVNPVSHFQIYDKLDGVNTIVYKGHIDHFEDESGIPTTDLDQAYYVVATSKLGDIEVDSGALGHARDNTFVAGWDQHHYWLEVDKLFDHMRYKICRPVGE